MHHVRPGLQLHRRTRRLRPGDIAAGVIQQHFLLTGLDQDRRQTGKLTAEGRHIRVRGGDAVVEPGQPQQQDGRNTRQLAEQWTQHVVRRQIAAHAGTTHGDIGGRRESDCSVRRPQALVANPGQQSQGQAAAGGIPRNHAVVQHFRALGTIYQQPAPGIATVLDAVAAAVLRDQPVIERKHRGAGEPRQTIGNGTVTARTAGKPGAAVNVEQAPAWVMTRRQHPLATQLAIIDRFEATTEFDPVAERVHQLADCPQPTPAPMRLSGCREFTQTCEYRAVLGAGLAQGRRRWRCIVAGQVFAAQVQQAEGDKHQNRQDKPDHGNTPG